MSANNEFPESYEDFYCSPIYDGEDVDDWFKRCLEDFPEMYNRGYSSSDGAEYNYYTYNDEEITTWLEKWFSQFRNE